MLQCITQPNVSVDAAWKTHSDLKITLKATGEPRWLVGTEPGTAQLDSWHVRAGTPRNFQEQDPSSHWGSLPTNQVLATAALEDTTVNLRFCWCFLHQYSHSFFHIRKCMSCHFVYLSVILLVGWVVQSVHWLTMGWMVRGSNPGGARFSAPVQTGPGAHLVKWVPGLSLG